MPSRSIIQSAPSAATSSTFMPMNSSEAIEAVAWEIAQPWPWKREVGDPAVLVDEQVDPSSSPQSGLTSCPSRSWGSSSPKLRGFL